MLARTRHLIIAIIFALIYPGLGHLYLKSWVRAITWFLLATATTLLVVPTPIKDAIESGGISVIFTETAQLPFEAYLALAAVNFFNVVDVYLLANAQQPSGENFLVCPNCGQKLDPDLSFCPWCTTILE